MVHDGMRAEYVCIVAVARKYVPLCTALQLS
jgi:hypothetical protein